MKRFSAILLCSLLTLSLMTGCSKKNDVVTDNNNGVTDGLTDGATDKNTTDKNAADNGVIGGPDGAIDNSTGADKNGVGVVPNNDSVNDGVIDVVPENNTVIDNNGVGNVPNTTLDPAAR